MSDDMAFAEGCYRLEGGAWQVITAIKTRGNNPVCVRNDVTWDSGVTGMNIILPDDTKISAAILLATMSSILQVDQWHEVQGPDSMMLR